MQIKTKYDTGTFPIKEKVWQSQVSKGKIKCNTILKMVWDFVKHYNSLVFMGDKILVHMITEGPKSAGSRLGKY